MEAAERRGDAAEAFPVGSNICDRGGKADVRLVWGSEGIQAAARLTVYLRGH